MLPDLWVRTSRVLLEETISIEEMMDTEEAEALDRTMADSVTVDSKSGTKEMKMHKGMKYSNISMNE